MIITALTALNVALISFKFCDDGISGLLTGERAAVAQSAKRPPTLVVREIGLSAEVIPSFSEQPELSDYIAAQLCLGR